MCPGTYDPVTFGHLDIISRAARVFDSVVVGGRQQAGAQGRRPLFDADERVEFIDAEVAKLENVQVKSFDNLLVEFARENGATAIVKGLRAISDFEYEFEMNQLNRTMDPEIESIYLMSSPQFSFLSSSGVKELAMFGGDLSRTRPGSRGRALEGRASALTKTR